MVREIKRADYAHPFLIKHGRPIEVVKFHNADPLLVLLYFQTCYY